jgi:hypothetical protein
MENFIPIQELIRWGKTETSSPRTFYAAPNPPLSGRLAGSIYSDGVEIARFAFLNWDSPCRFVKDSSVVHECGLVAAQMIPLTGEFVFVWTNDPPPNTYLEVQEIA